MAHEGICKLSSHMFWGFRGLGTFCSTHFVCGCFCLFKDAKITRIHSTAFTQHTLARTHAPTHAHMHARAHKITAVLVTTQNLGPPNWQYFIHFYCHCDQDVLWFLSARKANIQNSSTLASLKPTKRAYRACKLVTIHDETPRDWS